MRINQIILSATARLACLDGWLAHEFVIVGGGGSGNGGAGGGGGGGGVGAGESVSLIAAVVAGVSTGTTTVNRPELSTEYFLIPETHRDKTTSMNKNNYYNNNANNNNNNNNNINNYFSINNNSNNNNVASVASVISVPAPNRTISIYQQPPHGYPTEDLRIPGYPVLITTTSASTTITTTKTSSSSSLSHQTVLRQRSWALPLAALSAATMIIMAGFEIFVILKARAAAPSRRHLFLGQALLLGLFLLAGLSAAASLTPNPFSCAAFRLIGLPAALVFSALLVKCVFLLSLNSGVYLPAPYQALVLLFAVLVQVAIIGQWFYGESPAAVVRQRINQLGSTTLIHQHLSCKTPLGQTTASLGYPGILLIAVTCLAIRAREVRDNYREAAFIGLAVGITLPIWLTSAIGSIIAVENDKEAWLAYGLLTTSLIIFLTMFLPKGRQLAALGREGPGGIPSGVAGGTTVVIRDRGINDDDRLSSLPESGYSPSFFHFKPTETSLKRKMHYQSADRVALVSSGIPGCSACRHGSSPVYSEDIQNPLETFVLPHGMYIGPELDAGNLYTTLSANPNVFFQRAHPGMIY